MILLPSFEYHDEQQASPIDRSLGLLVEYGLVDRFISKLSQGNGIVFFQLRPVLRLYLDGYFPLPTADTALTQRFARMEMDIAQRLANDLINPHTEQMVRYLFLDIRRGLDYCQEGSRAEFAHDCAQIATFLGDEALGMQFMRDVVSNTDLQNLGLILPKGSYITRLRRAFPAAPETPQEQVDQLMYIAADKLVDLGILRKKSLYNYDFVISFPAFVAQMTLTPVFSSVQNPSALDTAIISAIAAIKVLTANALVPSAALLAFGLGRLYSMKQMFAQANTQFNKAIKLAKEMGDVRLRAAAHHELSSIRVIRGFSGETNTLNNMKWSADHFRACGDFRNASAAALALDTLATLSRVYFEMDSQALHLLSQSGLSQNAYYQSNRDIEAIYERLVAMRKADSVPLQIG